MSAFELPGRYDVVLCLFSSIGYLKTLDNVRRALERLRAHLADGGIVIVEPWLVPGALTPGRVTVNTAEGAGVTVCRMSRIEVEGRLSRLHFEYLIGRATAIERAGEVHELGLFTVEEMQACFRQAGSPRRTIPRDRRAEGCTLPELPPLRRGADPTIEGVLPRN